MALSEQYVILADQLSTCTNNAALFRLAQSDNFRKLTVNLSPNELEALREHFQQLGKDLDGKVKLEQFDGQILILEDIGFWHSNQWNNDGVTLRYRPESDQDNQYKSLTSAAAIVRFCNQLDRQPTPSNPIRIMIHKEPVSDGERAAAGQRQWKIKRMPEPGESAYVPF